MNQKRAKPINLKEIALKALFSRLGWALKLITSLIMSGLSYFLIIILRLDLEPATITTITEGVAALVFILLQYIALKINVTATKEIQNKVKEFSPDVQADGWIGEVTKGAIEKASVIARDRVYKADVVDVINDGH